VFDLSITKLFVLAVIALVIFGPNELPKIASQAGRALRDLRKIAEGAKNDLREGLGPEFSDFEIEDLNPKRFVAKHLFDDMNGGNGPSGATAPPRSARPAGALLAPGERAPYDPDAT
jgi:sec-independent protein translocase protein TatB